MTKRLSRLKRIGPSQVTPESSRQVTLEHSSQIIRKGLSAARSLAAAGCLVAGLTVSLAFVLVLQGCAPEANGGYSRSSASGTEQPTWPGVYEIITKLELEPEQMPAVRSVLEDAEDAREEVYADMASEMSSGRGDPSVKQEMRGRINTVNEQTEDQLGELLTTEQMSAYRSMMRQAQRWQEQMRSQESDRPAGTGRRGGGGKGGR